MTVFNGRWMSEVFEVKSPANEISCQIYMKLLLFYTVCMLITFNFSFNVFKPNVNSFAHYYIFSRPILVSSQQV